MRLPLQAPPVARNIIRASGIGHRGQVSPAGLLDSIFKYGPYAACYWACKAGGGDWVDCETECLEKYG